ncbi:hypothetical protein VE03_10495 [Pseudogymnoascus sp. 23342-1-I1]|nr:hypothetical protein VE03_10495 [Pseudogymnoascus sp. 23342-1-I1]
MSNQAKSVNGDVPLYSSSTPDVPLACELLRSIRPAQSLSPGSTAYSLARHGFWSTTQSEIQPACIFQPESAADVSLALIILQQTRCPFAVKSGGHGRYAGESTVENGVLIDLVRLDQITIAEDSETVVLGPGNRWLSVYAALEPMGLVVVGGRDADVGVGGFLLGGGISFLSSAHGWASDNIEAFEVVLSNGTIRTASATDNPDLYRALRGGGGNFGIVTAFTLKAYPYNGMWGGMRANSWEDTKELLAAFVEYGHNSPQDPRTSLVLNHSAVQGQWTWYNDLEHCDPMDEAPELLKRVMRIPPLLDETKRTSLSALSLGLASHSARGFRNSYWALCTKLDLYMLEFYVDVFVAECSKLNPLEGFDPAGDIQVITSGMLSAMKNKGGNILGLQNTTEPLLLFNPALRWTNPAHDTEIKEMMHRAMKMVEAEAMRRGLQTDFLYMNYASEYQDPLKGYGAEQFKFIEEVASRYDPNGVFQTLRTSGFKLRGAPISEDRKF